MILPFDISEYAERLERVKQSMEDEGVEVLCITNPSNMNYLSGYDAWSFYVHQMLIVVAEENQPYWIGRSQDANGAKISTWLDDHHILFYPDDYVQSKTKHPMDFIAGILRSWGYQNRRIGVDMDNYYFTALCFERLKAGLPDAVLKDTTSLVNVVRMIKSPKEITYMKNAAKIVEKAMQTGVSAIRPGVRENDVVAKVYHSQLTGTDEFGGDYPAIVPLMPSGIKTSAPHLTWSDGQYQEGNLVILELAGCYRRYHSPLARTVKIGVPTQREKDITEAVIEGIDAVLNTIKPGVTCEEAEAVWRKTIGKHGYVKNDRIGYSVGLSYPPDWGEHTASIREGDQTVFQPNMTFHFIPGIWQEDCGIEISEAIVITENGCETLANYPRGLLSAYSGEGGVHGGF
ncbi:MAG TPA: M24 family metallopeptidase [Bacillales bacterium]|nr:M24 family metallopeptidase [Bacillales bacterium]